MEVTLNASELKFKSLFERMPQPAWVIDLETLAFLEVNMAASELYGYSLLEFLSMRAYDICPDANYKTLLENSGHLHNHSNIHNFQHVNKNGELFDVEVSATSIEYEGKNARYEIIHDITGKQKVLNDIIIAKEKAEASDKLKSAFINNISHEVRTPLNGVIGFSEMLINPDVSSENKIIFNDIIRKSSVRLLKTINSYMDISMIVSGNMEVFNKQFALYPLLDEIRSEFAEPCKMKGLELRIQRPAIPSEMQLNTDPDILRKIFTHLLDNAVKFTRKGTIEFGFRKKRNTLEFFVDDTGIGIEPEKVRIIFENFMQADTSLTRGYEGSGLGLSISNGLVRLLEGELKVETAFNKGSSFYFTIPDKTIISSFATEKVRHIQLPRTTPPVILVAEDDEFNFKFIEIVLKRADFKVIRAENGSEAVKLCKNNPEISLVLMDLKMPVMGGIEATRQIKDFLPQMPVIALTAYVSSADEYDALINGCDEYIPKPVNRVKLIEMINKLL
jgi:PAS domain S-box-containing protein